MGLRLAGLRADDAMASHRAADGVGPPIEGARTYAGGTPRGAVARFRAFLSAHRKISIALLSRPRIARSLSLRRIVEVSESQQPPRVQEAKIPGSKTFAPGHNIACEAPFRAREGWMFES